MAVGGGPLAGTWNGRTWRWLAQPPLRKNGQGNLTAVSCLSASRCLAVGYDPHLGIGFGDVWTGRAWQKTPLIAGHQVLEENGVSCVTAAYCVAVGAATVTGQDSEAAAVLWNGASWHPTDPVVPAGATKISFAGVSCASAPACMAVGTYNVGWASHPLTESWNGKAWSIQNAPSGMSSFAGVSCPGTRLCLAAGTGPNLASLGTAIWNGSAWTELSTPNPDPPQLLFSGISCPSATDCIAVGGGLGRGLAEQWKGGTGLKVMPFLSDRGSNLNGISCLTPSRCLTVGAPVSEYGNATVASWNGRRWQGVLQAPQTDAFSVSCAAKSICVAVGDRLTRSFAYVAVAERWNGRRWINISPAIPGPDGTLWDVSCPDRLYCLATGPGTDGAIWNVSRWRAVLPAPDAGPDWMSCLTERFCMAISGLAGSAVTWHGRRWRSAGGFIPPDNTTSWSIANLSCATPALCIAVGAYTLDPQANVELPLANIWNGTTWKIMSVPHLGGGGGPFAISCIPGGGCMVLGWFNGRASVAEWWHAGHWRTLKTAVGMKAGGLSCTRPAFCMAVNSYGDSAEAWNGKTWRLTPLAGPSGMFVNSVSCSGPAFCIAVGRTAQGNAAVAERWNGSKWQLSATGWR
jgi:hypothetical protein